VREKKSGVRVEKERLGRQLWTPRLFFAQQPRIPRQKGRFEKLINFEPNATLKNAAGKEERGR
jgi:hypothetical protein